MRWSGSAALRGPLPTCLAACLVLGWTVGPAVATGKSGAPASDLVAAVDAASAYASSRSFEAGIAILDRRTGVGADNGAAARSSFPAASVVKLFIAEDLLHRQRYQQLDLRPEDRARLESMLTDSDDGAASFLYDRYGGSEMVEEVAERYGLTGVTAPDVDDQWELTGVTAVDVEMFYDRFLDTDDPADVSYLVGLLRAASPVATDGFSQFFGIPAALPGQTWGIKQGWMCCPGYARQLHTTGILGADNRYVVVVLTQYDVDVDTATAVSTVNWIVAELFPGGRLPGDRIVGDAIRGPRRL